MVTSGGNNTAVGQFALGTNSTASNNTAVGYQAGYSNTTGQFITALGYQAGYTNTTGGYNVFIGDRAGQYSSTVNYQTMVGDTAGQNTTGAFNTFIGAGAGYLVTSGAKNTILGGYNGNQGGLDIRTASNYIVLSDGDGNPRQIIDSSGNLLVGTTSGITSTNPGLYYNKGASLDIGRTGTTNVAVMYFFNGNGNIGSITTSGSATAYNTSSDYRLKDITGTLTGYKERIMALQPKQGSWKSDGSEFRGFLAHEFANQYPTLVNGEKDAVDAEGKPIYQGMQAGGSETIADLVALIQELCAEVDSLKQQLGAK